MKLQGSNASSAQRMNSSSPYVSSCNNSSNCNVSNLISLSTLTPPALPTIKKYNNNTLLI